MRWEKSWQNFVRKLEGPILPRPVDYNRDLIKRYHEEFGSPADSYPVVHVAGTNGKGSVTYKISKILELSGYRTGFYQSPHLFSWTERVQVDSEPVSKEFCADFFDRYLQVKEKMGEDLSFFGLVTLLGAQYFRHRKVDVAVWEVGMGGRLDATNLLINKSLLSIVTSISLDHTEYLGDTIDQIAGKNCSKGEKCAIFKKGCPCLIGPSVPLHVAKDYADRHQSSTLRQLARGPLVNDYTEENNEIVRAAVETLRSHFKISPSVVDDVLHNYSLPCRTEYLYKQHLSKFPSLSAVVFDVGHNPDGVRNSLEKLKRANKSVEYVVLFGCKQTKDYASSIGLLKDFSQTIYLVKAKGRSASVSPEDVISKFGSDQALRVISNGDISLTIHEAIRNVPEGQKKGILIIGSFSLMREARQFFGIVDPNDD